MESEYTRGWSKRRTVIAVDEGFGGSHERWRIGNGGLDGAQAAVFLKRDWIEHVCCVGMFDL